MSELCGATGQFNPVPQSFLLQQLLSHTSYFTEKCKALPTKTLPPIEVALKFSKAHVDSAEVKESILKETVHFLVKHWCATAVHKAWFVELSYPAEEHLRKLRKSLTGARGVGPTWKKMITDCIDNLLKTRESCEIARRGCRLIG